MTLALPLRQCHRVERWPPWLVTTIPRTSKWTSSSPWGCCYYRSLARRWAQTDSCLFGKHDSCFYLATLENLSLEWDSTSVYPAWISAWFRPFVWRLLLFFQIQRLTQCWKRRLLLCFKPPSSWLAGCLCRGWSKDWKPVKFSVCVS